MVTNPALIRAGLRSAPHKNIWETEASTGIGLGPACMGCFVELRHVVLAPLPTESPLPSLGGSLAPVHDGLAVLQFGCVKIKKGNLTGTVSRPQHGKLPHLPLLENLRPYLEEQWPYCFRYFTPQQKEAGLCLLAAAQPMRSHHMWDSQFPQWTL